MNRKLVCVKDYEVEAKRKLSQNALGYYNSGATSEITLIANENDFNKWHIRPRVMRDISNRNMKTCILGNNVSLPFGIAPTAMQKMANDDGECASAKAAEKYNAIYTLSTIATTSIEEIASTTPHSLKFFQLYVYKDRDMTRTLIKRAEKAGFKALVLTVDAQLFGIRYADIRNDFQFPRHIRFANFSEEYLSGGKSNSNSGSSVNQYITRFLDQTLTWNDIRWIQSITTLPIVAKGILTTEDALLALDHGVAAIWVSNHGARQVDGVLSSIEALTDIVKVVDNRCQIFVDGGFRNGSDIFKGLALGADMVFLGRPFLWGLASGGEDGVSTIFEILKNEFDNVMALAGCCSVKDISREMVRKNNYSSKL